MLWSRGRDFEGFQSRVAGSLLRQCLEFHQDAYVWRHKTGQWLDQRDRIMEGRNRKNLREVCQNLEHLLPFKNCIYPVGPVLAVGLNIFLVLIQGWSSFSPKSDVVSYVSYYIGIWNSDHDSHVLRLEALQKDQPCFS